MKEKGTKLHTLVLTSFMSFQVKRFRVDPLEKSKKKKKQRMSSSNHSKGIQGLNYFIVLQKESF